MNIFIGYEIIESTKSGSLRKFIKLQFVNDEYVQTKKNVGHPITEVFFEGDISDNGEFIRGDYVDGKLTNGKAIEMQGEASIGSYCRVMKESINGRDELTLLIFSPRGKK